MKPTKKVLYFMNVDWSWIRQRPHILAQELEKIYDVLVIYPKYPTRPWKKQKKTKKTRKCYGIFQLPFAQSSKFTQSRVKKKICKIIGNIDKYDIVWLSTPYYIKYIPNSFCGVIIYDDMDDIVALQTDKNLSKFLEKSQNELFERASKIIVTSKFLYNKLPDSVKNKSFIVRNGTFINDGFTVSKPKTKDKYLLGYVGTVSEWFDFSLLNSILQKYRSLECHIYGPNMVPLRNNENIFYHGIIEHDKIPYVTREIDCYIMPFIINDITLAVDPVKLYEYISYGKCIISVYYPEVEHFEPFVYFYRTEQELTILIEKLISENFCPKYSAEQQERFLKENSWENRILQIQHILE